MVGKMSKDKCFLLKLADGFNSYLMMDEFLKEKPAGK